MKFLRAFKFHKFRKIKYPQIQPVIEYSNYHYLPLTNLPVKC